MLSHRRHELSSLIYNKRFLLVFLTYFIDTSYQTFVEIHSLLHASVDRLEYNLWRLRLLD
jgi:hypothetical protein